MTFEQALVVGLNRYYKDHGIKAIAYRHKQARYTKQVGDVFSDSRNPTFYLLFEAKSIDASKDSTLYFSQHFHQPKADDPDNQITAFTRLLELSGRQGFLAVELRGGRGHPSTAHILPWGVVEQAFTRGLKGFDTEVIQKCVEVPKEGRELKFDSTVFQEIGLGRV